MTTAYGRADALAGPNSVNTIEVTKGTRAASWCLNRAKLSINPIAKPAPSADRQAMISPEWSRTVSRLRNLVITDMRMDLLSLQAMGKSRIAGAIFVEELHCDLWDIARERLGARRPNEWN